MNQSLILDNFDLLFGNDEIRTFSFNEPKHDWMRYAVSDKEVEQEIKQLNKKFKNPNTIAKKVRELFPKISLLFILRLISKLNTEQTINLDSPVVFPQTVSEPITIKIKQKDNTIEVEQEQEFFQHPSSFVGIVIYDIQTQSLTIQLNERVYQYCNFPQRVFDSFEGAPSKGQFYNRNIKGRFLC